MGDLIEGIDFYGNKVLRLDKNPDTRWYNSLKDINKALLSFILKNLDKVAQWHGSEDPAGLEAFFKAAQSGSAPTEAAPKVEESKQAPKVVAPIKKGPPAKKAPVTRQAGMNWVFENYDKENLKIEGDDKVAKNRGHSYFNCTNMEIRIVGKVKSVFIEGCKNVVLYIDKCVAEVTVMNTKGLKIFGQEQMQSVTVEKSQEVNLYLNHKTKNCTVYTICTSSIWIQFPKDGADDTDWDQENWHRHPVPEQYETMVKGTEIVTIPSDNRE